jgi:hypothetical protein
MKSSGPPGSGIIRGLSSVPFFALIALCCTGCSSGGPSVGTSSVVPTQGISLVPARTSGVAPLSVVFDGSGTTNPATSRPYHELDYSWSFADPNSGVWNNGSNAGANNRNIAYGPVASHIFELPGTYAVTLTVFDGVNSASTSVAITVQDPNVVFPGRQTVCISARSLPVAGSNGCPSGADIRQQPDWPTIISTYAIAGNRVLLRRGDTFTGATGGILSNAGPGIIGAYGLSTDPKPVIRTTGSSLPNGTVILSLAGTVRDWRIMDLEFDGQSDPHRLAISAATSVNLSQFTMLRLYIHDIALGVGIPLGQVTPALADQIAFIDSKVQHINCLLFGSGCEGLYLAASQLSVMGNFLDDSIATLAGAEHLLRIQTTNRSVISNNTIQNVNPQKEMIALRALCSSACPSGNYFPKSGMIGDVSATRVVVISDNHIKINSYIGIQIDTSNDTETAIFKDILLERNWFESTHGAPYIIRATEVTIRNELMDITHAQIGDSIALRGSGSGTPGSQNIHIYNNTIVSLVNNNGFQMLSLPNPIAGVQNIWIQNNLGYAPNNMNNGIAIDQGVAGIFAYDHNSTGNYGVGPHTNQIRLNSPNFVSASPSIPIDFMLAAGSYANSIGAGVPIPGAFRDFFGNLRGSTNSMGAFQ